MLMWTIYFFVGDEVREWNRERKLINNLLQLIHLCWFYFKTKYNFNYYYSFFNYNFRFYLISSKKRKIFVRITLLFPKLKKERKIIDIVVRRRRKILSFLFLDLLYWFSYILQMMRTIKKCWVEKMYEKTLKNNSWINNWLNTVLSIQ